MAICQAERSRTSWGNSWAWYKSQLSGQLAFKRLAASLASCQCHPCAMQKVNAAAWRAKEFRWWPRCDDVRRGELALCGLDWLRAENLSPRECPLFPACPRLSKLQTARITLDRKTGILPPSLRANSFLQLLVRHKCFSIASS